MISKFTYAQKRERITDLFMRNVQDEDLLFNTMDKIESIHERADSVARMIIKFLPRELAMYKGNPYLFNGEFYEPIAFENLKYGLDDFLYKKKVKAGDRTEKVLYHLMKRIEDRMNEHVLKPRLSLMCFQNCVLDINTMQKYEFSTELDVIKQYDFKYDRRQIFNCKIWNSFIGENYLMYDAGGDGVLPEKHKRKLLQMFLGACLMDRKKIAFEYFMILQGTGANGKSVIQKVLAGMFGEDEMLNIKLNQFSRSGDEGLRAVASMEGKRLLHCTESSKKDFTDMSIIKAISSGEPLAGREIGGNIRQFQRPPLLICNSNYRWKIEDFLNRDDVDDISVQRRAVIINFDKTIPVEKRDAMLADKMRSEYAGIFAWIVKGLVDLKKSNWKLPESFDGRVDRVLGKMSSPVIVHGKKVDGSVAEWLARRTCYAEQNWGGKKRYEKKRGCSDLYYNYRLFCEKIGIHGVSQCKFGRDMSSFGFMKDRGDDSEYTMFVEDDFIADNFDTYVPSLAAVDTTKEPFDGFDTPIDEFANETDVYGMAEEGQ